MQQKMEASFSVLAMSIASSAAMALGIAPHPEASGPAMDRNLAKFNIDLLLMLKEKTKGNLTTEEQKFIEFVTSDLQMKYLDNKE